MKLAKLTHPAETGLDSVIKVLSWVAIVLMLVMMMAVVINVFGRLLFNRPLMGIIEIVELLMVPVGFFSIFYTASVRGHVIIDLLFIRLPRRVRVIAGSIGFVLSFGIWAVITYRATPIALSYWHNLSEDSTTLSIPFAPFRSLMVLAGFVLCLSLLVCAFRPLGKEKEEERSK